MGGDGRSPRWDVFVSYADLDRLWAEWVADRLESDGLRVLIQAWDAVPGSNWPRMAHEGVRDGAYLVAVVTPAYLRSVWGSAEWQAVWSTDVGGADRRLIPVLVEPCDRRAMGLLGTRTCIDLTDVSGAGDDARARAALLAGVGAARAGRARPSPTPTSWTRP